MTRSQLNQAVSRATGEDYDLIDHRGFSLVDDELPLQNDDLEALMIDWDEIQLRVTQPSTLHAEEGAISSDGTRVAFRASSHNGEDLWVASVDGSSLVRLTNGNMHPQQIQWSTQAETRTPSATTDRLIGRVCSYPPSSFIRSYRRKSAVDISGFRATSCSQTIAAAFAQAPRSTS